METKEALRIAAEHIVKSPLFKQTGEYNQRRLQAIVDRSSNATDAMIEVTPISGGVSVYLNVGYNWGDRETDEAGDMWLVQRRRVDVNWGTRGATSLKDARAMLDCYMQVVALGEELEAMLPADCREIVMTKAQIDAEKAEQDRRETFRRHEAAKRLAVSRVSKCMRVNGKRDLEKVDLLALKESGLPLTKIDTRTVYTVEDSDSDKVYELSIGSGYGWAEVRRVR